MLILFNTVTRLDFPLYLYCVSIKYDFVCISIIRYVVYFISSYVGNIFKYVWFFLAETVFLLSFKVKLKLSMILYVEVDIMVKVIHWICLVAGIAFIGWSGDMFSRLWGVGIHITDRAYDIWDKRGA